MFATTRLRRQHKLLGVFAGQSHGHYLLGDAVGVVADSLEPGGHLMCVGFEDREGRPRVVVPGFADRAAVDEADAAVLVYPGLVGVAEEKDFAVGAGRDARRASFGRLSASPPVRGAR